VALGPKKALWQASVELGLPKINVKQSYGSATSQTLVRDKNTDKIFKEGYTGGVDLK